MEQQQADYTIASRNDGEDAVTAKMVAVAHEIVDLMKAKNIHPIYGLMGTLHLAGTMMAGLGLPRESLRGKFADMLEASFDNAKQRLGDEKEVA